MQLITNIKNNLRIKIVLVYGLTLAILLITTNFFALQRYKTSQLSQLGYDFYHRGSAISNNLINWDIKTYKNMLLIKETLRKEGHNLKAELLLADNLSKKIITHDNTEYLYGDVIENNILFTKDQYNIIADDKLYETIKISIPIIIDDKIDANLIMIVNGTHYYNNIRSFSGVLFFVFLILFISILIITIILANTIINPLEAVTKAMSLIVVGGQSTFKVIPKHNDQIGKMIRTFNLMSIKLEQVDKQRRDFIANVSHELRTPLSSMKILAGYLLLQKEVDKDVYQEFLGDINSEIDRLNGIIDTFLSLVNLEREDLSLNLEITYLNFLLERIVRELRPLAQSKSITLNYYSKEKIQTKVDGDKLKQAIINLIDNAIKYTKPDGYVTVNLYQDHSNVTIAIKDTGVGIPPEDLHRIFERFYRVDRARTRTTGGIGLGLSIANQIVQLHGGRINVESYPHKGTTFYIVIPKV